MEANRGPNRPVSHFAESDYCFGTGALAIRVDRVDWNRPVQRDGAGSGPRGADHPRTDSRASARPWGARPA